MIEREDKARELILYIADGSIDDPHFGATKLNKILAFSDFESFAALGDSITGLEYQKLEHGPAPRHLLPLQRALISSGAAQLVPIARGSYVQQRLVALRAPDLSLFTAPEIALVDEIMSRLRSVNATGASDISHQDDGWRAAELGETIPYEAAFWRRHELSSDDIERARQLARAGVP